MDTAPHAAAISPRGGPPGRPAVGVFAGPPGVHIPAHDGHLSDLMAVRIPGAWRSAFRRHGGQFVAPTGMLTAMSGIGL